MSRVHLACGLLIPAALAAALQMGCAGYWYPSAAGLQVDASRAYLAAAAMNQGCPFVGLSKRDTRRSLGRLIREPMRADTLSADRWRRAVGRGGVVLELEFSADTLAAWRVAGHPDPFIAKRHVDWAEQHAVGFPDRVQQYLRSHPETSAEVAFVLYRSCLQVGLTEAEVAASWGPPDRMDTVQVRGLVRWRYGYGVEGQYDAVIFREGRLVQFLYVDPMDRRQGPSTVLPD